MKVLFKIGLLLIIPVGIRVSLFAPEGNGKLWWKIWWQEMTDQPTEVIYIEEPFMTLEDYKNQVKRRRG